MRRGRGWGNSTGIVQSWIWGESLYEEFCFISWRNSYRTIRSEKRREGWWSKVIRKVFGKVPEGVRGVLVREFSAFMTNEVSFGRSKNRLCTILGSDIRMTGFTGGLALVPVESPIFVLDSIRTSVIKPLPFCSSQRIGKGNVCFHAWENHLRYVKGTRSWLSAKLFQGKSE